MGSQLPKRGEIWQKVDDESEYRYVIHGIITIDDGQITIEELPQIILYQRVDSDGNPTGSNMRAISTRAWQDGEQPKWKRFGDDWWSWE